MERDELLPVTIAARDLDDAWFQLIDASGSSTTPSTPC